MNNRGRMLWLTAHLSSLACLALWSVTPILSQQKVSEPGGWKILVDGKSLQGWHPLEAGKLNQWQTAAAVTLSPQDPHLFAIKPGKGIIVNGDQGNTVNLLSDWKHGDVEAHVEFAVSKNSNSGVYFMGLYEIQIFDSYGKTDLTFIDCGSVYARWINEKYVGGELPRVNASRAPGEWQAFDVQFRAPRFDGNGSKTENAQFIRVVHNGVTVHENTEVDGPTRASMEGPETKLGPLMLQGDHGPVAYRNIRIREMNY